MFVFMNVVNALLFLAMIPIVGALIALLALLPLSLGPLLYCLNVAKGQSAGVGNLFEGFRRLGQILSTMLLMAGYMLLWSIPYLLAFLIPVAGLSYLGMSGSMPSPTLLVAGGLCSLVLGIVGISCIMNRSYAYALVGYILA